MKVIGITGPTGAGKTTVLNVLSGLGGAILDCDALYHELTRNCEPMRQELASRYGADIFDDDGVLKRKELGAIVFADKQALADLNEITHRYVSQGVKEAIELAKAEDKPAVAVDAIALLESGLGELCDCTLAVTADDELRVYRIMSRDCISEEYARKRVSAQKPSAWFEEHCDYTIRNNGSDSADVEREAYQLFNSMINKEVI